MEVEWLINYKSTLKYHCVKFNCDLHFFLKWKLGSFSEIFTSILMKDIKELKKFTTNILIYD